jgi:hypothetical protein
MALTETQLHAAEAEFMREVQAYLAALLSVEQSRNDPQQSQHETQLRASLNRLVAATFKDRAPSQAEKEALVRRLVGPNDPSRFGRDDQPPGNR